MEFLTQVIGLFLLPIFGLLIGTLPTVIYLALKNFYFKVIKKDESFDVSEGASEVTLIFGICGTMFLIYMYF